LRQAEDGTAVGEVYRKLGISEATYYNWRKKYAGLTASEMKRLRQLEEENGKSKKIVADLSLDKAIAAGRDPPKSFEACQTAANGGSRTLDLASERSVRMPCADGRTIDLPLPLLSSRTGSTVHGLQVGFNACSAQ
jgi:putative transposase